MADYYGTLGVDPGASDQEIKRAYRKLARELHPDVNPAEEDRFKAVTTAYEVLSDPQKRRIVDAGGDPLGGPGGGAGFGDPFGGGLGDIFSTIFGGGGGGGFGGAGRGPRGRVRPGEPGIVGTTLTLDEVASGVKKEITVDTAILCDGCRGAGTSGDSKPTTCSTCRGAGEIQSVQRTFLGQAMMVRECPTCRGVGEVIPNPCGKCGGDGRVRDRRTLTVNIPAGVESGMKVRLQGQGEVGPGGGPAGDLYVEIEEEPHEVFIREGDDLHCRVRVPMADAALGTDVEIPTVLGDVARVVVDPGTQPGTVVRVRGVGIPHVHSGARGDLHAHLDVVVPERLDSAQRRLLEQLRDASGDASGVMTGDEGSSQSGFRSRLRSMFAGR